MAVTVYRVDPNHSKLRLMVILSMAAGFLLGVVGVPLLFRVLDVGGFPVLLGIVVGVLLAAGLAWLSERVLRRIWPSGREIRVTGEGITLHDPAGEETTLRWADGLDVTAWGFVIATRRAWVPKGWLTVALRLGDGEDIIVPYAFMEPESARELPGWRSFVELIPRKEADNVDEELFAGQEHLRTAEEERWWLGAEMTPEDFRELAATVAERVADWPEGQR